MSAAAQLLRRLAANDELCVNAVLSPSAGHEVALDAMTRALVRLSALIAADAVTETLRWGVELAVGTGAADDAVVAVLRGVAAADDDVAADSIAPRLALALDLDLDDRSEARA